MKKMHKILLGAGVTLCLGIGITSAIIAAQPKEQLSDLTLANLEAMALNDVYTFDSLEREDCTDSWDDYCGMTVSTPNGGYMEYLMGAKKAIGWGGN